jgi:hypothetical protein
MTARRRRIRTTTRRRTKTRATAANQAREAEMTTNIMKLSLDCITFGFG